MKKYVAIFVLSLLLLEGLLRLVGFSPYRLPDFQFESSPAWCFGKDSLGVTLMPGEYVVSINKELVFNVTHTQNYNRITSLEPSNEDRPDIFLFGCSYAYGTGVNDNETFPFLVQSSLPNYNLTNFARPGYGTLQVLDQLENALKEYEKPKKIILCYSYFHEERNLLSASYQYKLHQGFEMLQLDMDKMIYPMCKLTDEGFVKSYLNITESFYPLPFRESSALINISEKALVKFKSRRNSKLEASQVLIGQINDLCLSNEIRLVVADIELAPNSNLIHDFCLNSGIEYINISPDFHKGGFRNLPYDMHPNKAAHEVYASKLIEYLSQTSY